MCEKDLENLKNWKPDPGLIPEHSKGLSSQGKKDLEMLGQRLRKEFSQLLGACEAQKCKVNNLGEHKYVEEFSYCLYRNSDCRVSPIKKFLER